MEKKTAVQQIAHLEGNGNSKCSCLQDLIQMIKEVTFELNSEDNNVSW